MPGTNAVGINTAARISAMATTGPDTSSIAFCAASCGVMPRFDVVLHGFHHDDGVVDHQSNGQHQSEERERVDGEAENREDDECADQ